MTGKIKWNQYGRDAVLESKGEMSRLDVSEALLENERKAKRVMDEGWPHVVYGMKKYGRTGELACIDFMITPMSEEEYDIFARRCRNVLIYALHRR